MKIKVLGSIFLIIPLTLSLSLSQAFAVEPVEAWPQPGPAHADEFDQPSSPVIGCLTELESLKIQISHLSRTATEEEESYGDSYGELIQGRRTQAINVGFKNSILLSSQHFLSLAQEAYESLRPEAPSAYWGINDMAMLKERLVTYKQYSKGSKRAGTGMAPFWKVQAEDVEAKIKALKKEQKEMKGVRKEVLKQDLPRFADLPTLTRKQVAKNVWQGLKDFYQLPRDAKELSLEDTKSITEKGRNFSIPYDQFIKTTEAIKEIQSDRTLRNTTIDIIDSLLSLTQNRPEFLKLLKDGAGEKYVSEVLQLYKGEQSKSPYDDLTIEIKNFRKHPDFEGSVDARTLAHEYHNIFITDFLRGYSNFFLNEAYVNAVKKVFEAEQLNVKEFIDDFSSLSPVARQNLNEKVWQELKSFYLVDTYLPQYIPSGVEAKTRAQSVNMGADEFIDYTYLMRALEKNPETKQRTIEKLGENFFAVLKLVPDFQNKETWRTRLASKRVTIGKALLGTTGALAGGLEGVVHLNNMGFWHFMQFSNTHLAADVLLPAAGVSAAGVLAHKGYRKIRETLARRKFEKNLKEAKR